MRIPYVDLAAPLAPIRERLIEAVGRVLDHGQFILGPEVAQLEARLARRLDAAHVVGVNSGTDALELGLRLAGVERGDEVVTVSHSFFATASAVARLGARPVLVDIDARTMLIDPDAVSGALSRRTRAVVPVHLNGHPCAMDRIAAICERHGLALVEDCAQSFGARFRGRATGTFGIGCFSMHPLKVLPASGDAGFLAVAGGDSAEILRRWRNLGLADRDHCVDIAGNSRLDTLQAAMLLVELERLDAWMAARREHARAYSEALAGRVELPPAGDSECDPVWTAFVIRHPERDRLRSALDAVEVDARIHYPIPIHRQPAFADLAPPAELPVTDRVVSTMLSLPVSPALTSGDRDRIIETIRHFTDGGAAG